MADPIKTPPVKSADSPEELGFMEALKGLLKKHNAQEGGPGGQHRLRTINEAVDEAVSGAKGANPDY